MRRLVLYSTKAPTTKDAGKEVADNVLQGRFGKSEETLVNALHLGPVHVTPVPSLL